MRRAASRSSGATPSVIQYGDTNGATKKISCSSSSTSTGRGGRIARLPPLVTPPTEGPLCLRPGLPVTGLDQATPPPPSGGEATPSLGFSFSSSSYSNSSSGGGFCGGGMATTYDPRICRGSVFAARRAAAEEHRRIIKEGEREARYRVTVIRSQLESSLPSMGTMTTMTSVQLSQSLPLPPAKCLPPSYPLPCRRAYRSIQLPQLQSIDKQRSVTFTPIAQRVRKNYPMPDIVPTVNGVRRRLFGSPARVPRKPFSQPAIIPTPPPTDRPVYPIVESSVQTDDVEEELLSSIAKELASSAITRAQELLSMENQIETLRREAVEKQTELTRERVRRAEMAEASRQQLIEKDLLLAECLQREKAANESKKLALQTCKEITESSLARVRELEVLRPKTKSVGMDTRTLNDMQNQLDLVRIELEKDFFPWLFHKAERIFKANLAKNHLDNALLNEARVQREEAKEKLKKVIYHADHGESHHRHHHEKKKRHSNHSLASKGSSKWED